MKTNEMSFYKTNKVSFAKTIAPIHLKKLAMLHGVVLCAALGAALPGMAQPLQQGSGQATSTSSGQATSASSGQATSASSGQATSASSGQALPVVEIYKSAECGCCKIWAEHLQKNGFKVILHDVDDVPAARKKLGMPNKYGSCHSARVGQYLIEGHVPAADIKRLLKEHPKAIGLAVPSMPPGSPGMESEHPVAYDTLLIGEDGKAKVFARH